MTQIKDNDELKELLVKAGSILAVYLLKKLTEKTVEKTTQTNLPKKPDVDPNTKLIHALGYAAATGAAVGMVKLLIEKNARKKLDEYI